jgi:hypothetical protein
MTLGREAVLSINRFAQCHEALFVRECATSRCARTVRWP